jgi:hypothetical protein
VGTATALVEVIFRSNAAYFLDIHAVAACFKPLLALSWQGDSGGDPNDPCKVFRTCLAWVTDHPFIIPRH